MPDGQGATIPTAIFDGVGLRPDEWLAAFSRLTPGYDVLLPDGVRIEDFSVECSGWMLDDLVITSNTVTAIELRRTAAHIKAYARDTYTLIVLREGCWWTDIDDVDRRIESGQVCIMDFTTPWHIRGAPQCNVMMVMPRAVLDAAVPHAPALHGRLLQGTSGQLFAEHLLALATQLPTLLQRDVSFLRNATLCLLSNAVASLPSDRAHPVPTASRALPFERIRSYIDAHLTDPRLDAARICDELGVTRSTLYRTFHPIGGVASYIQCRRLEAARDHKANDVKAGSIADIADEYCFSSPAHFSTIFRRQFGLSPRDVRVDLPPPANAGALFETWLQVLGEATAPDTA